MGDLQHFCLRWNNYQSSITSAFENLRGDEDFVDVTLACDGKSLKAHRVVLSACSPYFRELLKSTPCKHPVIVLQDVKFDDLQCLVDFIYHGEVNVQQRSLASFLKTAEVLRVSGLTQQAEVRDEALTGGDREREREREKERDRERLWEDSEDRGRSPQQLWPSWASSTPTLRHRDRPNSAGDNTEAQENNSVPLKRAKTNDSNPTNHLNTEQSLQNTNNQDDKEEPPMDFSTTTQSSKNSTVSMKQELAADSPSPTEERIKSEPTDARTNNNQAENMEDSNDSGDILSEAGNQPSILDHDDSVHSAHQSYLDSKLFQVGASFNFSMAAALAADSLAGLNNQGQVGGVDGFAGTSQGLLMPPPLSGGINEPQDCPYCRRTFSCYYSLKRHFQDKHERSDTLYVCEFCHRRYRTKNSLTTHKSLQHRGTSGMLKRLLKTTAVFGQPPL
uniref:Broad-complex n=2 Tax=Clastoptera arizonana TaxID=38151 RepID=A0A1B6E5M1_9HEMI